MSIDCYCDYDPPEFWSSAMPRAKKPRRCEECSGRIAPGDRYERVAGKWDGNFCTFTTCEQCVDLRTWVTNNVPCFCWAHGNLADDAGNAIRDAVSRAPDETGGLRFGFLRRMTLINRHNARARGEAS